MNIDTNAVFRELKVFVQRLMQSNHTIRYHFNLNGKLINVTSRSVEASE